jgi:hypothetical protein
MSEATTETIPGLVKSDSPFEGMFERHHKIERVVDPKSSVLMFTLPGGYWDGKEIQREIEVDELDGEDEDVLVSDASSYPLRLNTIIGRKIKRIGNIVDEATIKRVVPSLSVLDRAAILICIRRVTHGDIIAGMKITCSACKTEFMASPDLSSITYIRPLQMDKQEWEFRLPKASEKAARDVIVRWHIYNGEREARISNVSSQVGDRDALTWRMMGRITAIDGVEMALKDEHFGADGKIRQDKSLVTLYRAVKLMSQADRNALRNEFRRVEGDIDLTVTGKCSNSTCGNPDQKFTLDITDRNFFFPQEAQSG